MYYFNLEEKILAIAKVQTWLKSETLRPNLFEHVFPTTLFSCLSRFLYRSKRLKLSCYEYPEQHQFEYKLLLIGLIPLPFPEVETQESAAPAAALYLSWKAWAMTERVSIARIVPSRVWVWLLPSLLLLSTSCLFTADCVCVCVSARTFEVESQFGWREVWLVITCESGDIERDKMQISQLPCASCRRREQRFWCTKRRVILSLLNLIDCNCCVMMMMIPFATTLWLAQSWRAAGSLNLISSANKGSSNSTLEFLHAHQSTGFSLAWRKKFLYHVSLEFSRGLRFTSMEMCV